MYFSGKNCFPIRSFSSTAFIIAVAGFFLPFMASATVIQGSSVADCMNKGARETGAYTCQLPDGSVADISAPYYEDRSGTTTSPLPPRNDAPLRSVAASSSECGGASNMRKVGGVCFPIDTGLSDKPIIDILGNLLQWLFGVFFFLSLIAFLVSGSQYLISAGDDDMIDTAKRNMKWSVVGVIVGLAGFVIVTAVAGALSANPIF